MIAESFGFVHFPILPLVKQDAESGVQLFRRNPKLCTPRDFDYSPYFEIIKYPFVDFSHHHSYRLLPWHGTTKLDGEESEQYLNDDEEQSPNDVDAAIELALQDPEGTVTAGDQVDPEQSDTAAYQDDARP
jgi:hypothetical protein